MTNALQRAAAFVLSSFNGLGDYCPDPDLPVLERDTLEAQLYQHGLYGKRGTVYDGATTAELALEIRAIADLIEPPDELVIRWTVEDIIAEAADYGVTLDRDHGIRVLDHLRDTLDPERGVTWDTIRDALSEKGYCK